MRGVDTIGPNRERRIAVARSGASLGGSLKKLDEIHLAEARRKRNQRRKRGVLSASWILLKEAKLYVRYLRGSPVALRDESVVTRAGNERIRKENWEAKHGKDYERPKWW